MTTLTIPERVMMNEDVKIPLSSLARAMGASLRGEQKCLAQIEICDLQCLQHLFCAHPIQTTINCKAASAPEQDFSVWSIRSGRFGLSRFGLSRFGLSRFGLSRFGRGTFQSWSFRSRDISVRL